jgi:hypothetical protein
VADTNSPPETQPTPILGSGNKPNTDLTFFQGNGAAGFNPLQGTGNLAQGDAGMSGAQQGLLASQIGKAYGNDTGSLMEGVGSSANGLLKDTPHGDDQGFNDALASANQNAVGQQANRIQSYLSATAPLRQATYEQDSAANLAKVSQLDMNDYMLYNQQQLAQMQLSQAQQAAQMQFVGQVVGAVGSMVGTVAKAAG